MEEDLQSTRKLQEKFLPVSCFSDLSNWLAFRPGWNEDCSLIVPSKEIIELMNIHHELEVAMLMNRMITNQIKVQDDMKT